jgi:hypothetical protein
MRNDMSFAAVVLAQFRASQAQSVRTPGKARWRKRSDTDTRLQGRSVSLRSHKAGIRAIRYDD